ncbi:MAG: pyridoxamine kinase [Clostridia bacterium]|nr:pyridoxamine kinase [Clostridia bacterium]
MPDDIKKILAVHDLSCFGRCALMVVIPALSAMGMQVVPLPTALLSTHTGGFTDMTFYDLSHTMSPALDHYAAMNMRFESIFTGFLGSAGQIDTVLSAIDRFGDGALVLVDPVMGDDGRVYQTYTPDLCARMGELCARASVITPNLTEACILCGRNYPQTIENPAACADELVGALSELYPSAAIALTGIEADGQLFTAAYADGSLRLISQPKLACSYPGTGDLFASVLLGQLLNGEEFHSAVEFSCRTVADFIADTAKYDTPSRDGLRLEPNLYRLIK